MTSEGRPLGYESEKQLIEKLRAQYEKLGYAFTEQPQPSLLPRFLGSYLPDALAQKPGHNVVIEIKHRQMNEHDLKDIRRLFDGRPDWQFRVISLGGDPMEAIAIPVANDSAMRRAISEAQNLVASGHNRAAFILAWSLLEAAFRAADRDKASRPQTPGTVVQSIAMLGYITPEVEQPLRGLIDSRNKIVHGDLTIEPPAEDIYLVLSSVEDTLAQANR